jgi:D-glycero-D-manno-heptose 1,7-bisphosphate phosphatase
VTTPAPAVFLDRDGTMIHDVGYLSHLDDVRWYPWTADAIRMLNRAGFLVLVTTNQGGVGLGYFTERFVCDTHDSMTRTLEAAGARIDGWFYCPHHPRAAVDALRIACDCRKPRDGMLRQAAARFPIDFARSFVVGDKTSDLGLGIAGGATPILVRTGYGEVILRAAGGSIAEAAYVADDLMSATAWILSRSGHPKQDA